VYDVVAKQLLGLPRFQNLLPRRESRLWRLSRLGSVTARQSTSGRRKRCKI